MARKESKKIAKAVANYEVLTGDEEVKRLAEVKLMADLEEQSALATARAKGTEIGLEQGEKIGREQGEKIGREQGEKIGREQGEKIGIEHGKKEIAKKMKNKNIPIAEIQELTGLSKDEILIL